MYEILFWILHFCPFGFRYILKKICPICLETKLLTSVWKVKSMLVRISDTINKISDLTIKRWQDAWLNIEPQTQLMHTVGEWKLSLGKYFWWFDL